MGDLLAMVFRVGFFIAAAIAIFWSLSLPRTWDGIALSAFVGFALGVFFVLAKETVDFARENLPG